VPNTSSTKALFDLASDGVYPAMTVTSHAVRSYHTFSPLLHQQMKRYIFCGTVHKLTLSESP